MPAKIALGLHLAGNYQLQTIINADIIILEVDIEFNVILMFAVGVAATAEWNVTWHLPIAWLNALKFTHAWLGLTVPACVRINSHLNVTLISFVLYDRVS